MVLVPGLLLAGVVRATAAIAQGPAWTATLVVQPFPSPFVADWQRNPQIAVLSVLYAGSAPQDFRIQGYVRSPTRGELARVVSPPLGFVGGPVTQLFNAADILDWATVSRDQQYVDLVMRTGVLPEGPLEMCAEVLDPQDARLAQTCSSFTIALPDPPQLIFPINGAVVSGLQPVFQWTPVRVPAEIGVTYRLRVFEVYQGQEPEQATRSNPTWLDTDVDGAPVLVYPIDALPLEDKKQYAWQVDALDAEGNPLTRGGRASEIWTFLPGGPGRPPPDMAGVLPDVIDLIPGVARLTGLWSVPVEEGVSTYVLNGKVRLEVIAPAAFEAVVEATDLAIDKISLQTVPRVTAGTLGGSLNVSAIPGELAGRFATFDRIEYAPASGLTLTGTLTLPATDPIPLAGRVQLTAAGLFGALSAAGAGGAPLTAYGSDPARLLVLSADVRFPAGTVDLLGDVELFKKGVACPGVTATLDAKGTLAAQVLCTPREPVALVAAGDRAQLDLSSLTGGFTYDSRARALSYELHAAAQLRLDARPGGANCGASLALDLNNDAVTAGDFTPRCDASEGAARLGWLATRLSSLSLRRFAYTPESGFDFELSVDLIPWIPAIPGFELPPLLAVTIGRDGLTIPTVDVTITRDPIIVAGFGLKVKRVQLPGFTLSWSDWQVRSATGFKFAFDADLSLPKVEGEAACLTAQPISITGAELSSAGIKAKLEERRFAPACGVTFAAGTRLASSDVGLTEPAGTTDWEEVYEKYGPDSDFFDNAYAWEKIQQPSLEWAPFEKLIVKDPSDRARRQKALDDEIKAKEAQLASVLDDPACSGSDLDPRARGACDNALREARSQVEQARRTSWAFRRANDFGPVHQSLEKCLTAERQRQLLGNGPEAPDLPPVPEECGDLSGDNAGVALLARADSLRNALLPLVRPPWVDAAGKAIRTPDPDEIRHWCDNDFQYAGLVLGEIDQRRSVLGGGGQTELEIEAEFSERTFPVAMCATQRVEDLKAVVCDPRATDSRKRFAAAQLLASERQRQAWGMEPVTDESTLQLVQGLADERQRQVLGIGPDAECGVPPPNVPERSGEEGSGGSQSAFNLRIELERFGGELDVGFYPFFVVNRVPEIEGNIVLPEFFRCTDARGQHPPLLTKLRLGPRGEINGSVTGFVPPCPIELPGVQLTVTQSTLTFSTEPEEQSVVLAGGVSAKFMAGSAPVATEGRIAVDVLHGRFIDGSIRVRGPFQLGLPRENPVVAFELQEAALDTLGIHIDARAELVLGAGQTIKTTFDRVTINPLAMAITEGRILFDASFGFEVGIGSDGGLTWGAVPLGAPLAVQTGLRIDLSPEIALSSAGFTASGKGGARILYEGRDLANLVAKFSPGFALSLHPVGISNGMVDFQLNGVSMAYIDPLGFHPNLAYFASAILPARLPLPTVDIAYLELRDAGNSLRVSTENTGKGVRIFTAPGASVPLIVPALQVGRATAPYLNVALDLTLDPLGQGVSLGGISATVPVEDEDAFDLSANGLPFAIHTVAYQRAPEGAYQWTLAGALKLFNQTQGGGATDRVELTLDGTGRLTGAVNLTPGQAIPIVEGVEGSGKLTLTLQSVSGSFDANLPAGDFQFDLSVTAGIDLALSANESYRAAATLSVSEQGVRADNITYASSGGSEEFKYLDLAAVQLGLGNLRIPELTYSAASGFRFRMLFDAALRFPALSNLTLPPIEDIELRNDGFMIPAYEAPALNLATAAAAGTAATATSDGPLELGGFSLNVLAFRMRPIRFNWFTGQGPTDWGFGFDLELGLGNLIADAPQALRDMRVQILDAGFRNGRLYGSLERVEFPTPLDIGIGKLYAISGSLPDPATAGAADAPFALTAELELSLGAVLPLCQGVTQISKPNSRLSIYGDGWFEGEIDGIVPTCPVTGGPFQVRFDQSSIAFGYGNAAGGARTRSLELAVGATVTFPGITEGETVTASGMVRFDILQPRWIDGRLDVLRPFRYQPADGNPFFAVNVDRASLDAAGLHFTAGGSLRAQDGASIGLQFNNLTFSLPDFRLTDGSVTFNSQFALGVGIAAGQLQWGVYSRTAPRPEGSSFRFIAPQTVTLDASGLALGGTATAELAFSDKSYSSLQVAFVNGFKVGFNPVAVTAGRANFILGQEEIAHVDVNGFWPGNVFGVVPVPARLGLPSEDVAYVQLRDESNNNLLIETQTSSTGLQLRTKPNQRVRLVVPALKAPADPAPPAVDVAFDVVVNPANFQFISGFVRAEAAADAPALMSLEGLGIPLTIRRIAFENVGGGVYGLRAAGRFTLPESLNNLKVDVPNLVITAQGLWGDVQMGAYLPEYAGPDAGPPPVLAWASFLGDTLRLDVTGVKLHFGSGASFALKGRVSSLLFKKQDEPPMVLKWSGSVSEQTGFTLQLDDTQNGAKLPIYIAEFEPKAIGNEPALRISADPQEFKVRLSGVLTVPSLSSTFALTIAGLQLGTRGMVFPTISIQGTDPSQELDLFGAKFRLKDSTAAGSVVYPALKVANDQGVMSVTLSGEVEFMDNISRFWGLKVATNGQISIAAASLLDRPLTLVSKVLTVDKVTIENNGLRTELAVTLPAPFDAAGAQKVFFGINANGTVTGGTTLALINQQPSLTHSGPGPNTHFTLGPVATVHLRYLGLTLDFANLQGNSSIQLVSDFYLQNNATNLIKLGDVTGNTVQPGLRIGFNGNVTLSNLALSREFSFDFQAVKLKITNVSLPPQTSGFAIGLSGKLGLNVAAVSGELEFKDFTVGSQGINFSPTGIKGGELSIASVVRLQLSDIAYSATPTTIQIKSGSMPTVPAAGQDLESGKPTSQSQSVEVASFISFGGTITVVDVFSGGVERFLFYRGTDQSTHLIIQQASLRIPEVVSFFADFRYDQTPEGFEMFMGASGTLLQTFQVDLVGAFAQDLQKTRAGIFLAVRGLQIQIGPYVTITGLGGGFFVNPKQEWLNYVQTTAKVSQSAGRYIAAPAAGFAVLLYGEAGIIRPQLIKGRLLVTISDTYFRLDGGVEVLDQGNRFTGDFHVQIAFRETDIQGNIGLKIDYSGVIDGNGQLNVRVQSKELWGVDGNAKAKIIAMLDADAEVLIGPAGFYFGSKMAMGYNIFIVKLEGFMDGQIWYLAAAQEFGAYVAVGVQVSVLGGILSAKGTLHGVIILSASPALVAAASLECQAFGAKWEGWAWIRFQDGTADAGLGQDPAMMAAIGRAQEVANQIKATSEETKAELDRQKPLIPGAVALTEQELVAAYRTIQGWPESGFFAAMLLLEFNEIRAAARLGEDARRTEETYRGWYSDVLRRNGLPGDSARVVQYTQAVANRFAALQTARPQVEARISALGVSIEQLNPMSRDAVTIANPVRTITRPTYKDEPQKDGTVRRVLASAPGFDIDEQAAKKQVATMDAVRQEVDANDRKVREQIAALEAGLASLRAATTSNDAAALPAFVGLYADVASQAEQQFAAQADVILSRQDWMRANLATLSGKEAEVTAWVNGKTNSLFTMFVLYQIALATPRADVDAARSAMIAGYVLLKDVTRYRIDALAAFSRKQQLLTDFDSRIASVEQQRMADGTPDWSARWTFLIDQANTSGRQLWYDIARAGMTDADAQATAGFNALASQADTRLGVIREAHGSLSRALDQLYQAQADATGALYDLYDRYLYLRTGEVGSLSETTADGTVTLAGPSSGDAIRGSASPAPTAAATPTADQLLDVSLVQRRRDELAQDLTVPRLNSVSVAAANAGRYTAQLLFSWSAWHPSGIYEFRFRDWTPPTAGDRQRYVQAPPGFYSNGGRGTLTSYRFTPDRAAASTLTRTFDVGVRGGAGFTGFGRTTYTLNFLSGPNTPVTVSGGGLLADNTPPSTPVVGFAGAGPAFWLGYAGPTETWTNNPDAAVVEWSAEDPESGIAEYEYALWGTPTGVATSSSSSTEGIIIGGGLALDQYGNVVSTGTSGTSQTAEIRPFTSAGGRTRVNIERLDLATHGTLYVAVRAKNGQELVSGVGVSPALRYDPTPPAFAAGSAITPVAGGTASNDGDKTYAACPIPEPALPGATPTSGGGKKGEGVIIWDGALAATGPTGVPPRATFEVPPADDPESGVAAYLYRVTLQPDNTYSGSGWKDVGAASQFVTAEGAPLDYQGLFYIAVAPRNNAGRVGTPLTYGPFRVQDPTPPQPPEICAGPGAPGSFAVDISRAAVDDESGIAGYQYRVRVGDKFLRDWTKESIDWPADGGTLHNTGVLKLADGQQYYVDVRALNGQDVVSGAAISGPVLYDASAPPAPAVSLSLGVSHTDGTQDLVIDLSAPDDPHSGLASVQFTVATTETGSDVVPWTSQRVVAGKSQLVARIPIVPPDATRWVQLRAVNGAGLPSVISAASVKAPPLPQLQASIP